jgi:hypothetical protein
MSTSATISDNEGISGCTSTFIVNNSGNEAHSITVDNHLWDILESLEMARKKRNELREDRQKKQSGEVVSDDEPDNITPFLQTGGIIPPIGSHSPTPILP